MPKQHIKNVSPDRIATSPYNFVPLPETVVPAEKSFDTLKHDRYIKNRNTGWINCTLITESPLYIRCGLSLKQFVAFGEKRFWDLTTKQQERYAQFFFTHKPDQPIIPGSSLRGMLRSLVEIVGYGKITKVSDYRRYFFRAMANDNADPIKRLYTEHMKNVQAGYLIYAQNQWFIRPASEVKGRTFWRVLQSNLPCTLGVTDFNDPNYLPGYINVSFSDKVVKNRLREVDLPAKFNYQGVLVMSGSMLETDTQYQQLSPRRNHHIVPETQEPIIPEQAYADDIRIDPQAIADYCTGLTDFQRQPPYDEHRGMLVHGRPVFYIPPEPGQKVVYFGHCPNFRIPYRPAGLAHAASPHDFVPSTSDISRPDLAEAIFGYVRNGQQCAGRVFISDAALAEGQNDVLYDSPIHPRILASPKPTTFQHYLVQPSDKKNELKHYESSANETQIRGHKLYWHRGNILLDSIRETDTANISQKPKQYTKIRPVKPQTKFTFTIRFENLSHVELGALLWVLHIAADHRFRLKLGMGKSLGMGSIKLDINEMQMSGSNNNGTFQHERVTRYNSLFDDDQWAIGERLVPTPERHAYIDKFTAYVLDKSGEKDKGCTVLEQTLRICCLLSLLTWHGEPDEVYQHYPDPTTTGFMELDEYSKRRVLPSPLQVIGRIPEPGDTVSGRCMRLNPDGSMEVRLQGVAPHVQAILPTPYARKRTIGPIKAHVMRHEELSCGHIKVWLEPL
jgi:CRISPR-associated protein (TIGR03986 family)